MDQFIDEISFNINGVFFLFFIIVSIKQFEAMKPRTFLMIFVKNFNCLKNKLFEKSKMVIHWCIYICVLYAVCMCVYVFQFKNACLADFLPTQRMHACRHALTNSLTQSFSQPFIVSFTHSTVRPSVCQFVRPCLHSAIHALINSLHGIHTHVERRTILQYGLVSHFWFVFRFLFLFQLFYFLFFSFSFSNISISFHFWFAFFCLFFFRLWFGWLNLST